MSRLKAGWLAGSLLVLGALALSGCSAGALGLAQPTPTPNAKTILANAQKVQYKDLEFKMTIAGSSSGTSVSGDGNGVITTSPKRAKISFNLTSSGQQVAFDTIEDIDGGFIYVKFTGTAIPGLPTDKWIKSSANGALGALTNAFDPKQLTGIGQMSNATLKGSETVDGIAVWHLTGTSSSGGSTANVDFWVRQDNYYPYKAVVHATAGTGTGDVTITFTGVNTGATVDIPTADQVMELPTP
jgi:hypothetical protein